MYMVPIHTMFEYYFFCVIGESVKKTRQYYLVGNSFDLFIVNGIQSRIDMGGCTLAISSRGFKRSKSYFLIDFLHMSLNI